LQLNDDERLSNFAFKPLHTGTLPSELPTDDSDDDSQLDAAANPAAPTIGTQPPTDRAAWQGLTHVNISYHRKHCLWDTLIGFNEKNG
jgi:hypothetical protein